MSIDLEKFFEAIGISTTIVNGHRYNETGEPKVHTWLLLNLPFGLLEFESTTLSLCRNSYEYEIDTVK